MNIRKETPLIQVVDEPIYPLKKEDLSAIKGVVLGGFLGGFLIVVVLLIRRLVKTILM